MIEYVRMIMEGGILLIISAVFIWDKITISKSMLAAISRLEMQAELQQTALSAFSGAMERHDKRAEDMSADLRAALELLKSQPCMLALAGNQSIAKTGGGAQWGEQP